MTKNVTLKLFSVQFGMKIIIIEDDALIAYQIKACVEKLGHEVLGSFDAAAPALEFIASNRPDFVFMDIELEGPMDGIQCASVLKSNYDIPSLFVTSHDEAKIIEEATNLDPLNFLPKPFTDKNIEAALALASIALKKHKPSQANDSIASLGEYTFNFDYSTLKFKETIVDLSPNETRLISLLFKSIGNIVSSDELISYIWEDKSTSLSAFRKLISRTNDRLIDIKIVSDRGVGYYLQNI